LILASDAAGEPIATADDGLPTAVDAGGLAGVAALLTNIDGGGNEPAFAAATAVDDKAKAYHKPTNITAKDETTRI
jgi:hypothetical protein